MSFLQVADSKQKFKYGLLMWGLLFFGYFMFCLNWMIMDGLQGDSQGWKSFFSSKGLNSSASANVLEASGFSISFAKGVAVIGAAWLMVKLSHKWSVVLALFFNTAAMPLIYAPHFALFIVGRMVMAIGGTMLVIFIQPIISRFFAIKYKGYLSSITPLAFCLASIASQIIFISGVKSYFQTNWQTVAAIFAGFSYLPLLIYPLLGKNFSTADNMEQDIAQAELPKNTYSGIIKEGTMWLWIVWYSLLLMGFMVVSLYTPKIFSNLTTKNLTQATGSIDWTSAYGICFFAGGICGMSLGLWNKLPYKRTPFIAFNCLVGLLMWGVILAVGFTPFAQSHSVAATSIIFVAAFLFAFFALGIQSVILYVPHEYEENDNAKRLTIFYSYLWGIGFILMTIYEIIISSLLEIKTPIGSYLAAGTITLLLILYVFLALTIREPRPDYQLHPWTKESKLASAAADSSIDVE